MRYSSDDWFDAWLPQLAPSAALMAAARRGDIRSNWARFAARYESEMSRPDPRRLLGALAALSHHANVSVGCYCEDERWCHRRILRQLLRRHGARVL